ncbi:MAG: WYL domain-containing protein, partial [Planctomycetales bacterium]|nr:WYL domain-containing protein [Planctomycetales bacterium]
LEGSFPRHLQKQLSNLTRAIRVKPTPVHKHEGSLSYYQRLVDAIARRRAVRIGYDSLTEWKVISTKLRPFQLLFHRRAWYVIGRSSLHRQNRTFHVGRITKLEELEETYRIPRGFSIERYLKNAWSLVPEPGPDYNVTVRFQPLVARNVAEVAWHRTQELLWNDDGTLDFSVTVTGLGEISWWILGYGANAEVLKPPQLRERVAEHAQRMLDLYRK